MLCESHACAHIWQGGAQNKHRSNLVCSANASLSTLSITTAQDTCSLRMQTHTTHTHTRMHAHMHTRSSLLDGSYIITNSTIVLGTKANVQVLGHAPSGEIIGRVHVCDQDDHNLFFIPTSNITPRLTIT